MTADWKELTTERIKSLTVTEVTKLLDVEPGQGLTDDQVAVRRQESGPNEIREQASNPLLRLVHRFWGLTPWMLEATIVLSLLLHKIADVIIISALLTFNAVLGYLQESRASAALDLLKKRLHISARVLRSGVWCIVEASELVPGDIVRIRTGDVVPADCVVMDGEAEADQSALTGESLATELRPGSISYSGTTIQRGEFTAVITLTGARTSFGKAVELVRVAAPRLHMEDVTASVVRLLLGVVGVMLCLDVGISVAHGETVLQILPIVLVLLVSAIPVALPAMFTLSMALGSLELTRLGVLVTRLSASEDAASMDVLCVDKTGTITANILRVADVHTEGTATSDEVILIGALASQAANDDPLDKALLQASVRSSAALDSWSVVAFKPFDQTTRRTEATVVGPSGEITAIKGAVEAVVGLCVMPAGEAEDVEKTVADWAGRGLRSLAIARRDTGGSTALLGLVALSDTVRPDSVELVRQLSELGISVKMITGDALPVARSVAAEVGLRGDIMPGGDLRAATGHDGNGAAELAQRAGGFAGVYPEDKYSVVQALQTSGHIVGMTGDGVNDAPALRQAEVGVATCNATDVAKGAASAVLTQEGLGGLVDLVRVGRMIHQRILTWIMNKVVKTFQVVVFTSVAFLITGLHVVSTFEVVLLLFLVDFVTLSIATDTVRWSPHSDSWKISGFMWVSVGLGIASVAEALGILLLGMGPLGLARNTELLQTYTFGLLFYSNMFTLLIVRERGPFWRSRPSRALLSTVLADMGLVMLLLTLGVPGLTRLTISVAATLVAVCAAAFLLINDLLKRVLLHWAGLAT
jgi:H+-transporting ATPase